MYFTERRKNKRVADVLSLNLTSQNQSECDVSVCGMYVVNISAEGLGFSCESQLPADTIFDLSFTLTSHPQALQCKAKVVSCAENKSARGGHFYSTRMVFLNIDNTKREILERHVEDLIDQTRVIKELPYRQVA